MTKKLSIINVKSTLGNRVALHEKHEAHPGNPRYLEEGQTGSPPGEAFISDDTKVYTVAKTPMVLERLSRGWLVEVSSGRKATKNKESKSDEK